MSNGSGLTLHISEKSSTVANLNLLIITNDSSEIGTILAVLEAAEVDFTYESAAINKFELLLENDYDAVIYNYRLQHICTKQSPLTQLECWRSLPRAIPLILVTDPLGDRIAVECIQYGISGYILRNVVDRLPQVLFQSLDKSLSPLPQENFGYLKHLEAVNKKLQEENTQLQAFKSKIEDYISDLIHELRNPIAAILGFSRMLQDEIYGALNAKQMQYVSATFTTGEHLLELVNNYLDLAKINANKQQLQIERISVEDICQAAIAMLKGKAKNKGLELTLDFKQDIDFCYADHLRLKQVLVNLLSNAIKFTKQGSVTLKVTTSENQINFAVIDTGIGISQTDCKKLFQPFEQIQTLLHRKSKGTGLGLALSRKLVELHGGKITLTSKIGEGTCFTVSLPH